MIGYDTGGPGGGGPDINAVRDAWENTVDTLRDRVDDVLEPVMELVERVTGAFRWVLETIELVEPIVYQRWVTAADEHVCPECGPLHGHVWEADAGPMPPVHVNCRCLRVVDHTEWRTRITTEWRLNWTTTSTWEWTITGWA